MAKRYKTDYPGVYYLVGRRPGTNKEEKIFYISYYKNEAGNRKRVEEKAGRQHTDGMTAAKANYKRGLRIAGKELSNEEKRREQEAKKRAEDNRWTIARLFKEYRKNNPNRKDTKNDENRFENHIKTYFGNKEPQDLLPLDVDRLRIKLLKTKAPATVKNILELLRRVCNFGKKKQLCPGLSFTIEMPKVDNEKTEDLSEDQLASLLKAIEEDDHPQAGPLMLLALYSGMRRGELFKLKWKHINFKRGFLSIVDPKGLADQKIPLNDPSRALLESLERTKSPYIFPGRGGHQRTDIKKAVNAIKEKAGLPKDFRPLHGLRHTYASALASSGKVDLYILQKLLTHKSPVMTQRYAHLRDNALKSASNVTSEIFKPKENKEKSKVINLKKD